MTQKDLFLFAELRATAIMAASGPAPKVGQRVEAVGKDCEGVVAYVGSTQFSAGKWIGKIKSHYII